MWLLMFSSPQSVLWVSVSAVGKHPSVPRGRREKQLFDWLFSVVSSNGTPQFRTFSPVNSPMSNVNACACINWEDFCCQATAGCEFHYCQGGKQQAAPRWLSWMGRKRENCKTHCGLPSWGHQVSVTTTGLFCPTITKVNLWSFFGVSNLNHFD